jgi:hypothetical protein
LIEIQQLFGILFSVRAFGGTPKKEEKWAFYSRYKYESPDAHMKKCHFVCVSSYRGKKSPFLQKDNANASF